MIASIGSEEFVKVFSAWGIKKSYMVEDAEDARKALWKCVEDNVRVAIVEEKFFDIVRKELKIIRNEVPEKAPIVVYLPGPHWEKLPYDPIDALVREAIGFDISRR
ncbi:MAG: hypothetical protein DRN30_06220 [Thermoplasmata archaeon]|nr:hypothetical protein [Euryarchaeota archaeon]RLF63735.1 MAG: hypothetical protein DRN30_06220 [Thermoplasmata archaeon]